MTSGQLGILMVETVCFPISHSWHFCYSFGNRGETHVPGSISSIHCSHVEIIWDQLQATINAVVLLPVKKSGAPHKPNAIFFNSHWGWWNILGVALHSSHIPLPRVVPALWTAQGWLHPFHRPQKHRRRCYDGPRMSKWAMYTCFKKQGKLCIYVHRLLIVHLWFTVWDQRTPALKKLKCLVASIASWMAEWKKVSGCGSRWQWTFTRI